MPFEGLNKFILAFPVYVKFGIGNVDARLWAFEGFVKICTIKMT